MSLLTVQVGNKEWKLNGKSELPCSLLDDIHLRLCKLYIYLYLVYVVSIILFVSVQVTFAHLVFYIPECSFLAFDRWWTRLEVLLLVRIYSRSVTVRRVSALIASLWHAALEISHHCAPLCDRGSLNTCSAGRKGHVDQTPAKKTNDHHLWKLWHMGRKCALCN